MKAHRIVLLLIFLVVFPSILSAQERRCSICHGKKDFSVKDPSGKTRSLYVNESVLSNSSHGKLACMDCHTDAFEIPHAKKLKKVDCSACHDKRRILEKGPGIDYFQYRESVHAKELKKGNKKAPDCALCHGSHDILSKNDIKSRGYRLNIPDKICGKCHEKALSEYRKSVHGSYTTKGDITPPVCTDCHTEHGIKRTADPTSTIYATNIVEMCVKCHGDYSIMQKYGKKTEEVQTYYESFHGVATKFGEKNIAHCASCHGYHEIRSKEDPLSTINVKNLPVTCGQPKCHPGATANFAKGKVHVNPKSRESGIIFWVAFGFKWLTITVLIVLFAHIFLDFLRKMQEKRKKGI